MGVIWDLVIGASNALSPQRMESALIRRQHVLRYDQVIPRARRLSLSQIDAWLKDPHSRGSMLRWGVTGMVGPLPAPWCRNPRGNHTGEYHGSALPGYPGGMDGGSRHGPTTRRGPRWYDCYRTSRCPPGLPPGRDHQLERMIGRRASAPDSPVTGQRRTKHGGNPCGTCPWARWWWY